MKPTSLDFLVQSTISSVSRDFGTIFFCPAFFCSGLADRKMQDRMLELPFMLAGATIDHWYWLWLQLWLNYDWRHLLLLVVIFIFIFIDNLYDDNLYASAPVARRWLGPNDFLWRRYLRLRDYHLSRLRVWGDGHGLWEIGNARRQTGRTHIRQWRRIR